MIYIVIISDIEMYLWQYSFYLGRIRAVVCINNPKMFLNTLFDFNVEQRIKHKYESSLLSCISH